MNAISCEVTVGTNKAEALLLDVAFDPADKTFHLLFVNWQTGVVRRVAHTTINKLTVRGELKQ